MLIYTFGETITRNLPFLNLLLPPTSGNIGRRDFSQILLHLFPFSQHLFGYIWHFFRFRVTFIIRIVVCMFFQIAFFKIKIMTFLIFWRTLLHYDKSSGGNKKLSLSQKRHERLTVVVFTAKVPHYISPVLVLSLLS